MPQWFGDTVGPLLGLVGTLAVALIGYRQWKRQHEHARYGGLLGEKHQAYRTAWENLEAVYLYVRSESYERDRFNLGAHLQ